MIRLFKENNCDKCPFYSASVDYCGEWEETCDIYAYKYGYLRGCKHILLVRYLLYFRIYLETMKAERAIKKDDRKRMRLGMSEEGYYEYTHKKSD